MRRFRQENGLKLVFIIIFLAELLHILAAGFHDGFSFFKADKTAKAASFLYYAKVDAASFLFLLFFLFFDDLVAKPVKIRIPPDPFMAC